MYITYILYILCIICYIHFIYTYICVCVYVYEKALIFEGVGIMGGVKVEDGNMEMM